MSNSVEVEITAQLRLGSLGKASTIIAQYDGCKVQVDKQSAITRAQLADRKEA